MDAQHHYEVVIIGGGFSGTLLAAHLAKRAPEWRILLADRAGRFGRGVAYGTESLLHLLNVPAGKMSAFPDDPAHFWNWVEQHRAELSNAGIIADTPGAFLPREMYGTYVREIFCTAREAAPHLITTKADIIDVERASGLFTLRTAGGYTFTAAKVVLALGNFEPGNPLGKDERFTQSLRYISTPWSADALRRIGIHDDILVLGSGLTALDVLLSLNQMKLRGQIHLVSRRGLAPQPHQPHLPTPDLFAAEKLPAGIRQMVRLVRHKVLEVTAHGGDWRAVVDALRPHTQRYWQSLSIPERRRFLRHASPYWETHRHRVAPEVDKGVQAMIARGQVRCRAARVVEVAETADTIDLTISPRGCRRKERLRVNFVINCTGPTTDYRRLKHPLIANLMARGLVRPDPLNLGLATTPEGAVLDNGNQPSADLFAIGTPLKGILYETTAVPELRVQARSLAATLTATQ